MRKVFLWASTNAWLRERAMRTSFVRRSVVKFMPGEHLEDAIGAAKALKPSGVNTILTRLGENLTRIEEAEDICAHYIKVIDQVKAAGLDAQISVKPTQLGFDQNVDVCFKYLAKILDHAVAAKTFMWLDMESSKYVDGTLGLYKRLRARSPHIGVAIQAYLFRTEKDIESLVPIGAAVRLVKGAYAEPADVAFPNKADTDENFFKVAARLLQPDADKPGALLHIATHDLVLMERLQKVIAERRIPTSRYEIAMLFGIQTARQKQLAQEKVPIRCLVSYGEFWFPWYMRRLAERPANFTFVIRNMFRK